MVKKLNLLNKILQICNNNKKQILILFLIVFVFRVKLYGNTGYIGRGALAGEILGGMLLIILSKYLKSNKYIYIGKETLIIYLTHMQIAGIINTRLPNIWIIDIIKPYFVLMLMYFSIYYIEKTLNKTFFKGILPFLGLRSR